MVVVMVMVVVIDLVMTKIGDCNDDRIFQA